MFWLSDFYKRYRCIFRVVFLAFFWTASLIYGVYFSAKDPSVVSLMRLLPYSQVSIVGLIVVSILPLLISIVFVYYRKPIVIYTILICKGFLSGYCIGGLALVYCSAGWIIDILLLFSDSCITLILLWFWYRYLVRNECNLKRDGAVAFVLSFLVCLIDHFIVTPFFCSLVNQL